MRDGAIADNLSHSVVAGEQEHLVVGAVEKRDIAPQEVTALLAEGGFLVEKRLVGCRGAHGMSPRQVKKSLLFTETEFVPYHEIR